MPRITFRWVVLVVVLAACGGAATAPDGSPSTSTGEATPPTTAATTTEAPPGTSSAPTTAAPDPGPDWPPAPLDEIPIADAAPLVLSDEPLPVLLVFWAEWCSVCRRELPVIDRVAGDYEGRVRFASVAWKGTLTATADAAVELLPSGRVSWALDDSGDFFAAWAVPYQPETVLLTPGDRQFRRWPGAVGEEELRARLDALLEVSAGSG
jgi:thiol-disulfide isomerase/thioredoxin